MEDATDTAAPAPPPWTVNDDGSITLQLAWPLSWQTKVNGAEPKDNTLSAITLRRPKAKDMRVVDTVKGEAAQALAMIAALSGQLKEVVDLLDLEDVGVLGDAIDSFTSPGRMGGPTSSET